MPTSEEIRLNVLNLYDRAYRHGDYEPTRDFLSASFACSNETLPMAGFEAIKAGIEMQRAAFENLVMEIGFSFASDDGIALIWTMRGRHVQEIYGVQPSFRDFLATGISVHELSDGKSIGAHACTDIVKVLQAAHDLAQG